MTATIKQMSNPYYMGEEDGIEGKVEFRSEIFRISYNDLSGDTEKYEALMEKMYPFDPASNLMINPYVSSAISKTWTKEGDLLIHVEYIQIKHEEVSAVFAKVSGEVDGVKKAGDDGYIVSINGVDHAVPSKFALQARMGDEVEAGDIIAGTDTPGADDMDY